jgi:uncharacterized iron-regulated membrane protein
VGLDDRRSLARRSPLDPDENPYSVDSTVAPSYELIRPWRRATLVAGAVAAVEFLLLVSLGAVVFGRPLEHAFSAAAHSSAAVPRARHPVGIGTRPRRAAIAPALRTPAPRSHLKILVLNGNGRNGAAAGAASTLRRLGYRIAATANAARQNYATSLVMYAPGYRLEGQRLARDLGVQVVGPLDGMRAGSLKGGELAVILGG